MSTGVEPRDAAPEFLDVELTSPKIFEVEIRDLQFSSRGRLQPCSDFGNLVVVEIQTWNGVRRQGLNRLLLQRLCLSASVEGNDAVTLRISNLIRKNSGAGFSFRSTSDISR